MDDVDFAEILNDVTNTRLFRNIAMTGIASYDADLCKVGNDNVTYEVTVINAMFIMLLVAFDFYLFLEKTIMRYFFPSFSVLCLGKAHHITVMPSSTQCLDICV
jgi:hypothetical protein